MRKFQVTIQFHTDEGFMTRIEAHRTYINSLIEKGVIDLYAVTMETQRVWITFSAKDKTEVDQYLAKSPLYKYWVYEIDELFLYDGHHYRLPGLQLN